jgi:hypothetical protein
MRPTLIVEQLEDRCLMSASPGYVVYHPDGGASPAASAGPVGLTPAQITHAYGIDQIRFDNGAIQGDGTGQTIAIIDAFDNPRFVNSTAATFASSDLHRYDLEFNLPEPTGFFTVVGQNGSNTRPGVDPTGGWEGEEALDVETVHALAPGAHIILAEANSNSNANLFAEATWAAQQPGVSVVSMSFSGGEFSGEKSLDSDFTTPAGHNGVTFVASTGDSGAPSGYPAYSANVLAVGGTTLSLGAGNSYGGEVAWSGSGGGISQVEAQPGYQKGFATPFSTTQRTVPDVAFDADPNSGFAVLDSFNNPSAAPWYQVGGTSFAAPAWAALIAIADQGRALNGLSSLDGATQTLPMLYALPGSDFHDITSGSNGFAAGPGYDLVTGRGTPVANLLVPDLASSVHVTGLSLSSSAITIGGTVTLTGQFSDLSTSQSHQVTINWGDGTTQQIVTLNAGTFSFSLSHEYTSALSNNLANITATVTNTITGTSDMQTTQLTVSPMTAMPVQPPQTPTPTPTPTPITTTPTPVTPTPTPVTPAPIVTVPTMPMTPIASAPVHGIFAVGSDAGGNTVEVFDSVTNTLEKTLTPFGNFTGGIRVAVGDVNGDGKADIICAAGPGAGPEVRVFDGKTFQLIRDFLALPAQFSGGVFVAAGDVNGDGYADIVTAADKGGGPQVTITDGRTGQQIASFYATASTFTGGIRVACGDLKGNGFADVIAAAGPGGGPQVTIFDGQTLSLVTAFYALTPTFTGGLYVSAGDLNGDGKAEIIAGAEKGGGPQVTVFDGASDIELASFYALPSTFTGGVRVGYSSNANGREALLATAGPGGGPQATVFDGQTHAELDSFFAGDPTFSGGLFVAGS